MTRRSEVRYVQFYAEDRPASAPVRKSAKRKRRIIYIDPLAIGGIAVALVMLALIFVGVTQLRQAQAQTEKMKFQVNALKAERTALEADFAAEVDLETVRWQAEALGMIPIEEAQHITVKAPELPQQEEPDGWERFYIFLTGLFA